MSSTTSSTIFVGGHPGKHFTVKRSRPGFDAWRKVLFFAVSLRNELSPDGSNLTKRLQPRVRRVGVTARTHETSMKKGIFAIRVGGLPSCEGRRPGSIPGEDILEFDTGARHVAYFSGWLFIPRTPRQAVHACT